MSDYQINEESTKGKYSLEEEMKKSEYIVLLFQRDYFCTNCRTQVQRIEERYEEFQTRNTQVVSILPENLSRSKDWSDKYDLSYPVIADVNSEISDRFEQPVRFGALGNIHDLLGRMPLVVILSCSNNDLDVVFRKAGSNPSDRPTVDDLLQEIDADD
jgi:peroxiredoxin Q/BCP